MCLIIIELTHSLNNFQENMSLKIYFKLQQSILELHSLGRRYHPFLEKIIFLVQQPHWVRGLVMYAEIWKVLVISLTGAEQPLASFYALEKIQGGMKCRYPLIYSLLWPEKSWSDFGWINPGQFDWFSIFDYATCSVSWQVL